jgi:ActR/RegA family two-component response regulator
MIAVREPGVPEIPMTLVPQETSTQESQLILILDDDENVTEGLAVGLEREGRTVITCNDVESAELIVEHMHPSHVVADIRISGPFGYEGLDFIRFAKRHAPESRIILISGDAPENLQREASERGATAFLKKPFPVSELDATIDMLTCSAMSGRSGFDRVIRMMPFDDILRSDSLQTQFQPIVRLGAAPDVFGYEALARFKPILHFAIRRSCSNTRRASIEWSSSNWRASHARSMTAPRSRKRRCCSSISTRMCLHPALRSATRLSRRPNALKSR